MENNRRQWSFSKEISIGDTIGLITALTVVLISYGTLVTRVALVEQSMQEQKAIATEWRQRIETVVLEINRKLDRLIERSVERDKP